MPCNANFAVMFYIQGTCITCRSIILLNMCVGTAYKSLNSVFDIHCLQLREKHSCTRPIGCLEPIPKTQTEQHIVEAFPDNRSRHLLVYFICALRTIKS